MSIKERLSLLRAEMEREGINACYIPTDDFHGSEYVSDYFKGREYLSGFTGSAGVLLVTSSEAFLWTDGRYFLQAEAQLKGSGITLMKMGEPGVLSVDEIILEKLDYDEVLGLDGRCVNYNFVNNMGKSLQEKHISIRDELDLVELVWKDRPQLEFHPVWELSPEQCGVSRREKLAMVRETMKQIEADAHILTSLEDIAWLLNIRGADIHCNPVVLSYLYLTEKEGILFADSRAFPLELIRALEQDGIRLQSYYDIYTYAKNIREATILADYESVNYSLIQLLLKHNEIKNGKNPTLYLKAVKNETELSNMRKAHIRDGAAVTRFLYYLKSHRRNFEAEHLTEMSAADILEGFRREQPGYIGPSFDPIVAFKEHGAIVHYSATGESDVMLKAESFLLVDTGGHYDCGTTDITRTISLGENPSDEEKKHYTLVLKGNLNLMAARFPKGICGGSLDVLAREPLWKEGLDFNHGTGHGVGFLLSVHEGPNAFRSFKGKGKPDTVAMEPGMITSDEPGLYLAGQYGIRLENLIECVEEENGFNGFRPLTFVPFDREAIDVSLLNDMEIVILNSYHRQVCDKIYPYLSCEEEKRWLVEETSPLGKKQ